MTQQLAEIWLPAYNCLELQRQDGHTDTYADTNLQIKRAVFKCLCRGGKKPGVMWHPAGTTSKCSSSTLTELAPLLAPLLAFQFISSLCSGLRCGPLMTMGPGFCFHPSDPVSTPALQLRLKDARMTSSGKDHAGGQAPIHLLELEASRGWQPAGKPTSLLQYWRV